MADKDSLQYSQRGVPGNIQIPQEDATVATAALVASRGSTAVTAAAVAAGVLSPSVAGATQVPTSASVLASLTGVVD